MPSFPRLAFRVGKSSQVKFYAPIIKEALRRQLPVLLCCGPDPKKLFAKNPPERPLLENIYFPGIDQVEIDYFESLADLPSLLKDKNISDLITLSFNTDTFGGYLPTIKKICDIHCLQSTGDYLYIPPESLDNIDQSFMYSSKMIELYQKAYPNLPDTLIDKFI